MHGHLGAHDPLLTRHPLVLETGRTEEERSAWHRAWLNEAIDDEELVNIRRYITQERAFGNPRFQRTVEKTLGQHAAVRANGRPVKTGTEEVKAN